MSWPPFTKHQIGSKYINLNLSSMEAQTWFLVSTLPKSQLKQLMSKWVDPECKIRTFSDLNNRSRKRATIMKKEFGSAVHVSNFLTETIGPLKDEQEEACVMMVLDANRDGYWDSKKLLEQVVQAVDIFERTHPKCVSVFVFDNATSHKAFAEDALVASKMNLGPGRSADPNVIDCCTCWLISNQTDFLEQCGQIQQEIESCRHKVLFYPKFHPEINHIEMYWGMAKRYTQSHCEYSLSKTRKTICEDLDSISVEQICSFAKLCIDE
ncbi:10793_t:CDS:2 [Cetraspora pellucida]|uniref:10793_t:CDS:1 n=1 Tax=Cetraspora pellucida TaxID=1433469 RepID=A0A9N9CR92_9GLOM|nr:10793_t:CDS:2 [Cetraspora pellucida]